MPRLARITIYPIKSLDGHEVTEVAVHPNGALANDRRWAISDAQGRWINGKRTPAVHAIRSQYDDDFTAVTLTAAGHGEPATFDLISGVASIEAWLGDHLQMRCRLFENADGGFPDDADAPGPTVISTSTIATLAQWYVGLPLDEMRRRLRANLELDAVEPFWEDRLADDGGPPRTFAVGAVEYRGRNICQRCRVPARDSRTGAIIPGFARTFAERRLQTLPEWSPRSAFDHFYRVAINTSPKWIPDGTMINVGDELDILEHPR
jgi:uncharacterized protein YcbX